MNRQCLLENKTLDLQAAYDQAYSLDLAQCNASFYSHMPLHVGHTGTVVTSDHALITDDHVKSEPTSESCGVTARIPVLATTLSMKRKFFFCGGPYHIRAHCPARDSIYNKYGMRGPFAKTCMSKSAYGGKSTTATAFDPLQSSVLAANAGTSFRQRFYKAATSTTIKGRKLTALVDSCSDDSYIDGDVAWELKLPIHFTDKDVALAQKSLHTSSPGYVNIDLTLRLNGETYPSTRLAVMKDLCSGVLIGQDFQEQLQKVMIEYRVMKPALNSTYLVLTPTESDKKYTAFEANRRLYQFCRVPFGVTNGVAAFQRTMDKLVKEENLQGAFLYLDKITIAGYTQEQHEEALQAFELLKQELEGATPHSVDENLPFEVECDALEVAVSVVLNQNGRPGAFMSGLYKKGKFTITS
ncbi:uncharacterized protein [Palaemon carinicauda]|uniref:uncharacterized protein n=1 Tax=Palaemon carinicauda TaxID=392227 RepID=UPI0035B69CB6